jgi:hypothetical protein
MILEHLDEWMAPFRINRWGDVEFTIEYDCTDSPDQKLLGSPQIHASIDDSWSIWGLHYFAKGIARDLRNQAYRQRVIPEGSGFVEDCIADQFVFNQHVKMTPELSLLLTESIEQTTALYETAAPATKNFLREALALLYDLQGGQRA